MKMEAMAAVAPRGFDLQAFKVAGNGDEGSHVMVMQASLIG